MGGAAAVSRRARHAGTPPSRTHRCPSPLSKRRDACEGSISPRKSDRAAPTRADPEAHPGLARACTAPSNSVLEGRVRGPSRTAPVITATVSSLRGPRPITSGVLASFRAWGAASSPSTIESPSDTKHPPNGASIGPHRREGCNVLRRAGCDGSAARTTGPGAQLHPGWIGRIRPSHEARRGRAPHAGPRQTIAARRGAWPLSRRTARRRHR